MTNEAIGTVGYDAADRGAHAKMLPQRDKANQTETRRGNDQSEPGGRPKRLARRPVKPNNLGIRIGVGDDDRAIAPARDVAPHWTRPSKGESQHKEMLEHVNIVGRRETRCKQEELYELHRSDRKEQKIRNSPF